MYKGKKVLITGISGQVGRNLMSFFQDSAIGLTRSELDLTNVDSIKATLEKYKNDISLIINPAAYTAVENAESDEENAYKANQLAPGIIAEFCKENNIALIHYSTDYVFDGTKSGAYLESDQVNPISVYGKSKQLGEENIIKSGCDYLIFRTSWVYDKEGANFVNTMLRLGTERESLNIVADQFGAPTAAFDIAAATFTITNRLEAFDKFPSGIYNLCANGRTNWMEFAKAIFDISKKQGINLKILEVTGISAEDYPTKAKRPKNSSLDMQKLYNVFGYQMPDWRASLTKCLEKKYENA